jgi:ATP-dependent Clp protease ATP-binding subunit ClpC
MTSNIGSRQVKDFGQGVGFNTSARESEKDKYAQGVIENALKKAFAPEFLNRVDDVVIFDSLKREHIHQIIDIELKSLYLRINELGYTIELTDKAKDFIVEKGWDEKFGARPLKRAIQKYVEDTLAEEIIGSRLSEGDHILLEFVEDKSELEIKITKQNKEEIQKPSEISSN